MYKTHAKNTIRYYLLVAFVLVFLFFSNDFGLIDVQKTAIVMAVGIDREADTFIVTSQIAVPQASTQGKSNEAVQIVSRGKTVGEALEEINAKTGWYPKLVFCDLIILGKKAAEQNVFDALDFFLRDEYMSDNCLLVTCEGTAKELLNTSALVDPSGSVAMRKVLSSHAERVGTVLPTTLREFAIGYFSDSKSGFMPILKPESAQESQGENKGNSSQNPNSSESSSGSNGEQGESDSQGGQSSGQSKSGSQEKNGQKSNEKPLFSAKQTALFVQGKWVETLHAEETFALGVLINNLQLASYSVPVGDAVCTLTIKRNAPKISLKADGQGNTALSLEVNLTAGIMDISAAQSITELSDAGDIPSGSFTFAAKKLTSEIRQVFEKTKACGCDVFGVRERLIKYKKRALKKYAETALQNTLPDIQVTFQNIR